MTPQDPNPLDDPDASPRRRHPLARGIELLTVMIDSDQDTHGVRELAGRLEVSPSTVHRLLTDLEKLGLVGRTETGNYRLGLEFLRLAWTTVDRYPLQEVSTDTLRELAEHSGETSFFAIYGEQRQQMMFSLAVESSHPLRYTLPLKRWIPLYAGASGLAILAYLPADARRELLRKAHPALTERTVVDPVALERRLEDIVRDGYALTRGERIEGAVAIASPVFGPSRAVVGSTGVSLPESRFNEAHAASLAGLVKQAAGQISEYLTGERDPRTGFKRS